MLAFLFACSWRSLHATRMHGVLSGVCAVLNTRLQCCSLALQGCTAPEVLQLVMSPELLGPMALPLQLVKPSCPREVFAFVEEPVMD